MSSTKLIILSTTVKQIDTANINVCDWGWWGWGYRKQIDKLILHVMYVIGGGGGWWYRKV